MSPSPPYRGSGQGCSPRIGVRGMLSPVNGEETSRTRARRLPIPYRSTGQAWDSLTRVASVCIKLVNTDTFCDEKVFSKYLHFLHFLHCPKLSEGRPSFGRQCTFGKSLLHCFCTFCTFCPELRRSGPSLNDCAYYSKSRGSRQEVALVRNPFQFSRWECHPHPPYLGTGQALALLCQGRGNIRTRTGRLPN